MKKFRVIMWEEATWEKVIEADNKEQAEEKAYENISRTGYVDWEVGNHGTNEITDVQEIE